MDVDSQQPNAADDDSASAETEQQLQQICSYNKWLWRVLPNEENTTQLANLLGVPLDST